MAAVLSVTGAPRQTHPQDLKTSASHINIKILKLTFGKVLASDELIIWENISQGEAAVMAPPSSEQRRLANQRTLWTRPTLQQNPEPEVTSASRATFDSSPPQTQAQCAEASRDSCVNTCAQVCAHISYMHVHTCTQPTAHTQT
jgi:hypothetical protein